MKNNSAVKCCICNNKKSGEFVIIDDKKYHLCCIEQLKDNWNELKEYCKENVLCYEVGDGENTKLIGSRINGLNVLDKMQELEQGSGSDE